MDGASVEMSVDLYRREGNGVAKEVTIIESNVALVEKTGDERRRYLRPETDGTTQDLGIVGFSSLPADTISNLSECRFHDDRNNYYLLCSIPKLIRYISSLHS